ncbi:MAG: hypothetical protein HYU66_24530 [Armatimonadetes bacterium]|nr:hypothetical protein [Armatimonadota bacterium]
MNALFYPTAAHLHAALGLCDDPAVWRAPATLWTLAAEPEPAYALHTETAGLGSDVTLEVGDDGAALGERRFAVTLRRAAPSLLQAVPLVPQPEPAAAELVYLRYADGATFRRAAGDCLMLGNDKLRYLSLGEAGVLRVEAPSQFFLAKWRDDPCLRAYYPSPAEPRLLVAAGWSHPLAAKLQLAGPDAEELWLVEADGSWRRLAGAFTDLYERVVVGSGGFAVEPLTPAGEPPSLTVRLRLEPNERPDRPQAWRLAASDRPRLEQLLHEATEAELNNLLLACVRDGAGVGYVLVERLHAAGRAAPPLQGGRAYAARLPEEMLYLPVGKSLQPLLSRRTLVEAMGLGEDHLTLVDATDDGGLRLTRPPRDWFRPLLQVVDYFAGEAAADVRALAEQVSFDFDLQTVDEGAPEVPAQASWWRRLLGLR